MVGQLRNPESYWNFEQLPKCLANRYNKLKDANLL